MFPYRSLAALALLPAICGCDDNPEAPVSRPVRSTPAPLTILTRIAFAEERYDRSADGWYELVETKTDHLTEIKHGNQVLVEEHGVETALPSRAAGEYSRLRVEHDEDGRSFLIVSYRFRYEPDAFISLDTRDEIEFVKGDWQAYETGDVVEFRLSEEGQLSYKNTVESQWGKAFGPVMDALRFKVRGGVAIVVNGRVRPSADAKDASVELSGGLETVYTADQTTISYTEERPTTILIRE